MARDILGNNLKPGDKIYFNGMFVTIAKINENKVMGAGVIVEGVKTQGFRIPDSMVLLLEVQGDFRQPINGHLVKEPADVPGTN